MGQEPEGCVKLIKGPNGKLWPLRQMALKSQDPSSQADLLEPKEHALIPSLPFPISLPPFPHHDSQENEIEAWRGQAV